MRATRTLGGLAFLLVACGSRTSPTGDGAFDAGASGAAGFVAAGGASATSGSGGRAPSAGGADDGREPASPCRARDIGEGLGFPVAEGVLAGRSAITSACGGKGPENWFRWTAPFDGSFSFEPGGADGLIAMLFDGAGCTDLSGLRCMIGAAISGQYAKGQSLLVGVDTDAAGGGFVLDVWGVAGRVGGACSEVDLGSAVGGPVRVGRINDGSRMVSFSCTGETLPAVTSSWTAPRSGYFVFDTTGSTGDTLLDVRAGCSTQQLGCSDDYVGQAARLELFLARGDVATIELGERNWMPADDFTLSITQTGP
jgi:hypothetical protein